MTLGDRICKLLREEGPDGLKLKEVIAIMAVEAPEASIKSAIRDLHQAGRIVRPQFGRCTVMFPPADVPPPVSPAPERSLPEGARAVVQQTAQEVHRLVSSVFDVGLTSATDNSGVVETASEVVDAVPAPAAPQPLVIAGELDMDAFDRAAAAREGREIPTFSCALFNTGVMEINSWGQRMMLRPEHTRELLRYVESLRGNEYVEDVLGEL